MYGWNCLGSTIKIGEPIAERVQSLALHLSLVLTGQAALYIAMNSHNWNSYQNNTIWWIDPNLEKSKVLIKHLTSQFLVANASHSWCNMSFRDPPIKWKHRHGDPEVPLKHFLDNIATCVVETLSFVVSSLTAPRFHNNYARSGQRNRPDGENWSVSVRPETRRERDRTAAGLGGNSPRNDSPAPQNHSPGPVEQRRCFTLLFIHLQV